jgi:hypothetical protein
MLRRLAPSIAVVSALALASCIAQPRTLDERTNPPIPATYNWRKTVAEWMRGAFIEPASLRSVMISDPVAVDLSSPATWLVCVEVDAQASGGGYMGPRRFALGFLTVQSRASILDPNSKPITSVAAYFPPTAGQIPAAECDRPSLRWTPWPEWQRTLNPDPKKRPG